MFPLSKKEGEKEAIVLKVIHFNLLNFSANIRKRSHCTENDLFVIKILLTNQTLS